MATTQTTTRAERRARIRQAWAERIAREVADAVWNASTKTGPEKAREYNVALNAARAAALQAFNEYRGDYSAVVH